MRVKHCIFFLPLLIFSLFSTSMCYAVNYHATHLYAMPWTLDVGLGYTHYNHLMTGDNNTVMTRLAFAKEVGHFKLLCAGLELGAQTGTAGKLRASEADIALLGGVDYNVTIKPMMDFLVTAKIYLDRTSNYFVLAKTGLMYRSMQFDRSSISPINRFNPECQAGLGVDINHFLSLSLVYQTILSQSAQLQINPDDLNGHVSAIPKEQSIFFTLSIHLDEGQMRDEKLLSEKGLIR